MSCGHLEGNPFEYCQMGSTCKQVGKTVEEDLEAIPDKFCVCEDRLVTNSTGHCTTKLLSDTASKLPGSVDCEDHQSSSNRCVNGAVCREGYCLCLQGQINDGEGRCVDGTAAFLISRLPSLNGAEKSLDSHSKFSLKTAFDLKKLVGDNCSMHKDCEPPALCLHEKCACPDNTVENQEHGTCVYRQDSVPPGSWCSEDENVFCNGGSHCHLNICVCPYGNVISGLSCVPAPKVPPGFSCSNSEICVGGSFCSDGVCSCRSGVTVQNETCQEANQKRTKRRAPAYDSPAPVTRWARPLEACDNTQVRCNGGSTCLAGRCQCLPGYSISSDEVMCMWMPSLDASSTISTPIFSTPQRRTLQHGTRSVAADCPLSSSAEKCELPECFVREQDWMCREPSLTAQSIHLFISHPFNNYDQTQWLYSQGHEIGVQSFTGKPLDRASPRQWREELDGMRRALERFSYVDHRKVVGVRAPGLAPAGEVQWREMQVLNYAYDTSFLVLDGPYWPQTLDYRPAWKCLSGQKCPTDSFPSIWSFPISSFSSSNNTFTTLKDSLKAGDRAEDVQNLLQQNFEHSLQANKAPFVVSLSNEVLRALPDLGVLNGLEKFLENVLQRKMCLYWSTLPLGSATLTPAFIHARIHQCAHSHYLVNRTQILNKKLDQIMRKETNARSLFISCLWQLSAVYPTLSDPTGSGRRRP
uniref:EGF-like domain-containing protein n=1 Tax=Ditylenchus dipsaci TaxID=166011 RepID=A0A915E8U7_9BILA